MRIMPTRHCGRQARERGNTRAGATARWALLLLGLLLPTTPAEAQDAPPWLEMTIVQVDPARVGEFLAAQREISALDEEAGVPWRSVGRTAVFGDTYRFVITTPLANFAQLDRAADDDGPRAGIRRPHPERHQEPRHLRGADRADPRQPPPRG